MKVDVVFLPRELNPGQLEGRACVVFDVLRATTTMAAALHAGVKDIHLFESLRAAAAAAGGAAAAAEASKAPRLLCGESKCLPPPGFDLGNSPGQFLESHRGATIFMATTNGTRALLAARGAAELFIGALVNASAVAQAVRASGRDVTLLCAGTDGAVAMEDLLGAGAVLAALGADASGDTDAARIALTLFESTRADLAAALRQTAGGRNVLAAGLERDIGFAAGLDAVPVVGRAVGEPLVVTRV